MASQITSLAIVYSTVYSDPDQRKHQSSASLAFVWGIHRWPVNSPHKRPVVEMFPFDDVIMLSCSSVYGGNSGHLKRSWHVEMLSILVVSVEFWISVQVTSITCVYFAQKMFSKYTDVSLSRSFTPKSCQNCRMTHFINPLLQCSNHWRWGPRAYEAWSASPLLERSQE